MVIFAYPNGICCIVPSESAKTLTEADNRFTIERGVPASVDDLASIEKKWIAELSVALSSIYDSGWNPKDLDAVTWAKHCCLMASMLGRLADLLPSWAGHAKAVSIGHSKWFRGQIQLIHHSIATAA